MTREQFLQLLEAYYGKYARPAQKAAVYQYLAQLAESCLPTLYRRLLLEYSGQFHFTPDVAILEGTRRKIDAEPNGWPAPPRLPLPEDPEPAADRETALRFLAGIRVRFARRERSHHGAS